MTATSPIARALEELQTERANLGVRLEKVDAAIATLRELFHLPAAAAPRVAKVSTAKVLDHPANGNGHSNISVEAIRAALKAGPLSPGALAAKLDAPRANVRYHVAQLEADGVVVSTGTTASRRVALAGSPAKEAP